MALVKCPECNKEISNQSKMCPHCGYKTNSQKNKRTVKLILCLLGMVLFIVLIAVIIDMCTTTTDEYEEKLRNSVQEYNEVVDRIDELEEQKQYNAVLEFLLRQFFYLSFFRLSVIYLNLSNFNFLKITLQHLKVVVFKPIWGVLNNDYLKYNILFDIIKISLYN